MPVFPELLVALASIMTSVTIVTVLLRVASADAVSVELDREVSYRKVAGWYKFPVGGGQWEWETGCIASHLKQMVHCDDTKTERGASPELRAFHLDCTGWKESTFKWQASVLIPIAFFIRCASVTLEMASNSSLLPHLKTLPIQR